MQHLIISFGAGLDGRSIAALQAEGDAGRRRAYEAAGKSTRARAIAAAVLHDRYPGSLLLFSGRGTVPQWVTEADAMKGVVMHDARFSIPASDVFTDTEAVDTAESVRNCVRMIRDIPHLQSKPIILVSGNKHLRRAARYFRAYGIRVQPLYTHEVLSAMASNEFDADIDQIPHTGFFMRIAEFLLQIIDPRGKWISRYVRFVRR